MTKSLFSKYFFTCIALILISIIFLGAVLLGFASQYLKFQKQSVLIKQMNTAIQFTDESFFDIGYEYIPEKNLKKLYDVLSNAIDADVFFVDVNGIVKVCSEKECRHTTYKVPEDVLKETKDTSSNYYNIGNMNGFLAENNYYTIGAPVFNNYDNVYGYIYISASSQSDKSFLSEIFKMFLISAIVVVMLTFIIIYFITDKLVKPLRQMAVATRSFASGDFSVKVPVKGYDEIAQLAMSFNNMAEAITTLEKTRRSFIANISHDLRTPMTTIGGFIEGILDGTIPPEKHKHYLNIVADEVKRLTRLVKVMMNVAKIEAGEINIHASKFSLFETTLKIMFTFEQKIDAKNIEIKGLEDPKIFVFADADLISQVIYNLIDNAVKFVNDNGYIEFEFTNDNTTAYFSITNSGIGIKKNDLDKIFDRFYKTDKSRGLDKNGVGLGLYIVKSIVNAHGGNILVNSIENKYCKFTFSLPVAKDKQKNTKKTENNDINLT